MKDGAVLEIKNRLPIIDLVQQYIPIEKAGKNFRARCPFHNEKTPSFYLSEERNTYYCFGCQKKGDIFSFIEEYEGIDFKEALKLLAEKTNVDLKEYSQFEKTSIDNKKDIYSVLRESLQFFKTQLQLSLPAQTYIESRGIQKGTCEVFEIGFAKDEWSSVYTHLKKQGYTDELIEQAGLIKKGPHGYYDRFRNRLMFPFFDTSGRVIGFSGRIISTDSKEAKYINSPEGPLFNKRDIFYGLFQAKDEIRKNKKVLVVEGQMDVVMTYQSGIRYVVASSGTAFSEDTYTQEGGISHLGILKRLTPTVYFAFDNDSAGIKAMYKAALVALKTDFSVFCIQITGGKDFAEIVKEASIVQVKEIIETKQDAILFFVHYLMTHTQGSLRNRSISEKIWPLVAAIKSPLEQSRYMTQIATLTRMDEKILLEDFYRYLSSLKQPKGDSIQPVETNISVDDHIKKVFGVLFYLESKGQESDLIVYENKLMELFKERYKETKESFEANKESLIFLIEKNLTQDTSYKKDFDFIYTLFEQEFLRRELQRLRHEIIQDELLGLDVQDKFTEVALISKKIQK